MVLTHIPLIGALFDAQYFNVGWFFMSPIIIPIALSILSVYIGKYLRMKTPYLFAIPIKK